MQSASLVDDCNTLIENCQSLMMATTNDESSHCSYVPYIWVNQRLYILVSALAQHTTNLKNTDDHAIGCMLIEDESVSSQIFARQRLMFRAKVIEISRDADQWQKIIELFRIRFGEIIDLLDSLPDFTLMELDPEDAVLVKGFGDAHTVSKDSLARLGG